MRQILSATVIATALTLTACGGGEDEDKPQETKPVSVLYDEALAAFQGRQFKDSIDKFEEVERQYPYSEWAPRAQLMAAYAGYRGGQFEDAVAILNRFVKLHPTHKDTPYAYYLKALCYYTQIVDVSRDQKTTEDAREALKDLIARYPASDYAKDGKLKLDLTEDHLAGKEMEIGRYYQRQQETIAAINRFKYVVDNFDTTSHTAEALHRLVECYLTLGVEEEAKKYAAVLGHNFPDSVWYKYSYEMIQGNLSPEEKKSFLQRIWKK